MAYKILETVIINSSEIDETNKEFKNYFCEILHCPWSVNGTRLRSYLKIHKISDGYIVEFNEASWGNKTTQYAGFLKLDEDKNHLVSHYF